MVGRRVRRNNAGKIRSRQILQGLVSYFKEFDIYSKGTEEPEQDLKQGRGKFAFSKVLYDCKVTNVLVRSNNGHGDQLKALPKPGG